VAGGDDLVDEPEPLGVHRAEVVAEEDELLRPVQADVAGEEERAARVDRDAAADEYLDEAGVLSGHDEIARVGEGRSEPRGAAVQRGERRVLEVPDGADDALA